MNPLFRTGISLALTLGIVGGFIAQTVAQSNKIQGLVSDKPWWSLLERKPHK